MWYGSPAEQAHHERMARKLAAAVGPVTDQDRVPAPDPHLHEGEEARGFTWPPDGGEFPAGA